MMQNELLTPFDIWLGYQAGAFPMGDDDGSVDWYQSDPRALFSIQGIRTSRSLARRLRKGDFEIRFDYDFEGTMRNCRRPDGNWINEEIIRIFTAIHYEGWAHSGEVWRNGRMVGGIYGLGLGGCFAAESMFHRETDMSKVALWAMVERCRELGFTMFDAEVMNPHLASLGAYEVPLDEYLVHFRAAQRVVTPWSVNPASTGF